MKGIGFYLAQEAGEQVAIRVTNRLVVAFERLAQYPEIGHRRSDLTAVGCLLHVVEPYVILFRRYPSKLPSWLFYTERATFPASLESDQCNFAEVGGFSNAFRYPLKREQKATKRLQPRPQSALQPFSFNRERTAMRSQGEEP